MAAGDQFTRDQIDFPYVTCSATNEYIRKYGITQLPIASPQGFDGVPVAIIQLCASNGGRAFSWEFPRQGKQPDLPDPVSGDDNEELSFERTVLENPTNMASTGVRVYRAHGIIVYLFKTPVSLLSGKERMWYPGIPCDAVPRDLEPSRVVSKVWQKY